MSPARTAGAVFAVTGCLLAATAATPGRAQLPTCFDLPATIVGTEGADELQGTAGDDVIVSLGGDDSVDGLAGNDRICSGDGDDSVIGDVGDDFLAGGAGSDGFLGLLGNDVIDGGADLDGIDGGLGDDRLTGGDGVDLVTYLSDIAPVRVDLEAGTATGHGSDLLEGFEAIAGSLSDDDLRGSGGSEFFFPRAGNDVVRGGGGVDIVVFLAATTANLATGTATGEGSDTLVGIEGLAGGHPGPRGSTFTGDRGDNFLSGSPGADLLDGRGGEDVLIGAADVDRLLGGTGADLISGGPGNDVLDGGGGNDVATYLGSPAPIRVELARGRATGEGTDRLLRLASVAGSQFGDVIAGDAGPNSLEGKGGDDRLLGLGAADFLDGGSGTDRLDGGGGKNYCLDGERQTRCQSSQRTAAPARQTTVRAPQAAAAPRGPATPLSGLLRALGHPAAAAAAGDAKLPLRAGGGAGTLGDRVQYSRDVPLCASGARRGTTAIAPPRYIGPLALPGTQEVRWRGILKRGTTIVYRTPLVEAVIAGNIPNEGYPAQWTDSRNRVLRKRVVVPITRPGVYQWAGEIMHVQTSERVTRLVAPPPTCEFR